MWNVSNVPKYKDRRKNVPIPQEDILKQIEQVGERLLQHREAQEFRLFQRLVKDFTSWAIRKEQEEEEETIQYIDPYAPVIQRAIDKDIARLLLLLKDKDMNSAKIAERIDEIQANVRDLIALKQK